MSDGSVLRNFIENQKISKITIAKDLHMSRQNLYQLFESSTLSKETKDKFVKYFNADIFTESINTDKVDDQDKSAKEEDISVQTIFNLSASAKNHSETDLINARNIERLLNLLEGRLTGKIIGGLELPQPGTPGTRTLTEKDKIDKKNQP